MPGIEEDLPKDPKQPELFETLKRVELSEISQIYKAIKECSALDLPMYIQKLKVLVEKPIKDSIKLGKCIQFCLKNDKLTTYRILDHFSQLLKAVSVQIPQTFNLMYDE